MGRYFMEVSYKGTRYSGFQIQENAITVQSEVEKAFRILHRQPVHLTGSSRTDAGVHALQNFFHFNFEEAVHPQAVYKLNAILPEDIVVKNIYPMSEESHSRFDAVSRVYVYRIHCFKNPFLTDRSLFYPYRLDHDILTAGAAYLKSQENFFAFSKTNTQVKSFYCSIMNSEWEFRDQELQFTVEANRFLRGMVRSLVGTLLQLARRTMTFSTYQKLFDGDSKCGISVPSRGLYLKEVKYPKDYFS